MLHENTDKDLLACAIATQCGLIEVRQLADACHLMGRRKDVSLVGILVEKGWLLDADRPHIDYLLERRIMKLGGLGRAVDALPADIKTATAKLDDQSTQVTLVGIEEETSTAVTVALEATLQRRKQLTLKGLHSTGGIGQVWIAYDSILEREVALKELKADKAGIPRIRERFFREAQLTSQLEHPGVVPVYEYAVSEDGARSYYTMRFVKGRTLAEAIRAYHDLLRSARGSPHSSELIKLLNAFVGVCQTVAYAHSRGIIHRDLKGDNIILGDFGEFIVLDWGLAKRLDGEYSERDETYEPDLTAGIEAPSATFTLIGEKLGTPAYMAPEQARGHSGVVGKHTDVYGLAAILYEILAGVPPFDGKSIVEILHRVLHEPPNPPSNRLPEIPVELERICLRGLSKEPGDRQRSASELAEQVHGWIAERAERKRTEQERERFFNLSLDLLAILDIRGVLTQSNPAWETVLGWNNSDLEGRTIWQFLHPDEHHALTRNLERILAGEPLTAVEHRCLCKDGSFRWVLWNANLIAGEAAIYIVGRDITERKQTEQTFQELLESAPDAMVVINDSRRIVLVNAQLERLFGYRRDELLGEPIELLVPEERRERHPAHVARFFANPGFRPMGSGLSLHGRRKDGTIFPVDVSLSPVRTEQGLLVSCAVRDATRIQYQDRSSQAR